MVQRFFLPGEEWLYYKFYVGYGSSNHILVHYLKPFLDNLLKEKVIDKWFFIRYTDPDPHLRVRIHTNDCKNPEILITRFSALIKTFKGGAIWKTEIGTYERELERYGCKTITETETLFYHDSAAISSFLSNNSSDELCFLFLLSMINNRLDNFHFSLKEKTDLFQKLQLNFKFEFNPDNKMIKSLSKKYRKLRPKIKNTLNTEMEAGPFFYDLCNKNFLSTSPVITQIMEKQQNGSMDVSLEDYLASLIHMNFNRMFRSKQRVYEMLACDFLYRYYNSELKKQEKRTV